MRVGTVGGVPDVITVTPNPTVDLAVEVDQIRPGIKLRCSDPAIDPGGGGINCARVVVELGGTASAFYLAGGVNGQRMRSLLSGRGVEEHAVEIVEETRQSFHAHPLDGGELYRFVLPGPEVTSAECDHLVDAVVDQVAPGAIVVASGSLPPGAPDDLYAHLARAVRERRGRLVLDTTAPALGLAADEGVFVLRNNQREMAELVGRDLSDHADQEAALAELVDRGAAEVVLMGLGAEGSLVMTADAAWRIPAPQVEVASVVGAGDSLTGALALGLARGWTVERAAVWAVAAGAAAVMTPRTELCRRADVERLVDTIEPRPVPRPGR